MLDLARQQFGERAIDRFMIRSDQHFKATWSAILARFANGFYRGL
jgi:hypothetical protein